MIKELDIDNALRDIENFLRNNIVYILKDIYGNDWEKHLGVTDERLKIWEDKMIEEKKRLKGNTIENRKIYYSDFYDLKTIIVKNWEIFKNCFDDKKIIEYQLSQLESFRNPNAHNRDLLEYQQHLLLGYIGEIKNGIMKYRGSIEKQSTFFPEYGSLNINGITHKEPWAHLKEVYRPGDELQITVYYTSPNTQKLYYMAKNGDGKILQKWSENNSFIVKIDDSRFGMNRINIYCKSDADYHRNDEWDDMVNISYNVVK